MNSRLLLLCGHTLLNTTVNSILTDGVTRKRSLRESFLSPTAFEENTLEGLFRGMLGGITAEFGNGITGELRNFLIDELKIEEPLDLPALNNLRGHYHGFLLCDVVSKQFGLSPFTSFSDIPSNPDVADRLSRAYKSVEDIDTRICIISEDHGPGSSLGFLLNTIVRSEFTRLRDGDSFYFESRR